MGRTDLPSSLTLEHRVTDFLADRLTRSGVPVIRQPVAPGRENLLARFEPEESLGALVWEAHQDTVPTDGMPEPFSGSVENGTVYGRGACDVKGGLAAMVAAFLTLHQQKPRRAATVTLACTVDEEHAFLGVEQLRSLQATWNQPPPDLIIVAEPTELQLVDTHKGIVRWQITTRGQAGHAARATPADNAIFAMARVVLALEAYANELLMRPPDPRLGTPSLNVGRILGGSSPNTSPDHALIELERRLIPGETVHGVHSELEEFLVRHDVKDFTLSPPLLACQPLRATPRAGRVLQLQELVRQRTGRCEFLAEPYATDAAILSDLGWPVVVFGPGSITRAHTIHESIALTQVQLAAEILYRLATLEPSPPVPTVKPRTDGPPGSLL